MMSLGSQMGISEIHIPPRQSSVDFVKVNDQVYTWQEKSLKHLIESNSFDREDSSESKIIKLVDQPSSAEEGDGQRPSELPPVVPEPESNVSGQQEWTQEKENILLGPYEYLAKHPGKDIRSQFISAFNVWLQVPQKSLDVIAKVIKMLHTASLLIDDIEDFSVLRRGIPVANNIFGVAQTINSANYVYFQALSELMTLGNMELVEIFTSELLNLHRGQGLDLYWRDTLTCPSEPEYLSMVDYKTGGLFRLAVRLMQAQSKAPIDCTTLVTKIGQLFQILDDFLNLSPTGDYSALKGFCEDLTEGKFSFPAIHAIQTDPTNQILIGILRLRTTNEDVKKYALKYIESKGSFEYCKEVIEDLRAKIEVLVDSIDVQFAHDDVRHEGGKAVKKLLGRLVVK